MRVLPHRVPDWEAFRFCLPFVAELELELRCPVTFLVGENGAGRSTLIEAVAAVAGLPVGGGSKNELAARTGSDDRAPLARALRLSFATQPRDGYFFRAEHVAHFAELLDTRRDDADFAGDPYARYGGRSLHDRSHGEAFLTIFTNGSVKD